MSIAAACEAGGTRRARGVSPRLLDSVRESIRLAGPSILQADHEGFSNEEGYHILWQFNDSVDGDWWMAVLHDGQWIPFEMNLGNREQRESFLQGQIPKGAI